MRRCRQGIRLMAMLLVAVIGGPAVAGLPETVARVKESVVAVGTYQEARQPPAVLLGTGFAVADGGRVVTNAHVLPEALDTEHRERLAIFFLDDGRVAVRGARRLSVDAAHDLALLAIDGAPLPPLRLGDSSRVREGELYAFTGFPIGAVLGLYPATHRGIVAAITPIVIPAVRSGQLDPETIHRLRNPFSVFQLDATAYPGNSGSPLYDPETGAVIGVVNSVFVKGSKEAVLEHPSGISYAVPAVYVRRLLESVPDDGR